MAALPLPAAAPLGGVIASGGVWTNEAALPSGSNVYAGDEIRTAPDAFAVLESPATGRVELRGDTRARVGEEAIALERGVVASAKLAVEIGDLEIVARDSRADNWFVVENREGRRLVAAYRGDVVIRGGSAGSLIVPAGSYAMAAQASGTRESTSQRGEVEVPKSPRDKGRLDVDSDSGADSGAASAGAKKGWSIGSLSHGASVAVVTGVTAAALGGAAVGGAFSDDSASPQD
jgi:hypothetical protein